MTWHYGERDGTRLACRDYGGHASPVLLLHGLAGYAEEWTATAHQLIETHSVYAPDQRGHGRSEHTPDDVSQDAFIRDVEFWIERLQLAPTTIVGQSLGALTGFLLAARRPELVDRLVVAEATPDADPGATAAVKTWINEWKQPFPSFEDAVAFFGDTNRGRTRAAGLVRSDDGYRPAFDPATIARTITQASATDYWKEWGSITRPTLIVHGQEGTPQSTVARMLQSLPTAHAVTITHAGHDIHLEQPDQWNRAIQDFI